MVSVVKGILAMHYQKPEPIDAPPGSFDAQALVQAYAQAQRAGREAVIVTDFVHVGSRRPAGSVVGAMRRDLPYCVHSIPGRAGEKILANRQYKPCGRPDYREWAKYEDFPTHAVQLTDEQVEAIVQPGKQRHLFDDSTAPWLTIASAKAYLVRLLALKAAVAAS